MNLKINLKMYLKHKFKNEFKKLNWEKINCEIQFKKNYLKYNLKN